MSINSESLDLTGLTVKCDALEVNGIAYSTTDMSAIASFVSGVFSASAAELNYNDIASLGTGAASKAVVLNADADYTFPAAATIVFPSGATQTLESGSTLNVAGTFQVGGVAVGATAAELNMAADNSANVEVVTATNVITAAESGKTFFLNSATEFVSTLPAPAAGLRYTFIVTAAPASASYTIVTDSAAQVMFGHQIVIADAAGDVESTGGATTITFVDSQAVVGDRAEVISDGTNWYVTVVSAVAAGATITG